MVQLVQFLKKKKIIDEGTSYIQRKDASSAYDAITSYEFVFIFHLTKEIMGITDILCQSFQQKSQDILNAMNLVSSTKDLIQKLKESGWDTLFNERHEIEIPNLNSLFTPGLGRCINNTSNNGHHYRVDIFTATVDSQLQKLNNLFNENAIELLILL